MPAVTFQPIKAATRDAGEPGHLVWVRDRLVALLVEDEDGWFLEHAFGPFEREGLHFDTIAAAEAWVRGNIPENWLDARPDRGLAPPLGAPP